MIKSLRYHKPKPSQHLINGLLLQIEAAVGQARHPDFKLEIAWVKGHMDIERNKLVDKAAKAAAQGDISDSLVLPLALSASSLPVSISACRQAYKASLNKRWCAAWEQSPHFARISNSTPHCLQTSMCGSQQS